VCHGGPPERNPTPDPHPETGPASRLGPSRRNPMTSSSFAQIFQASQLFQSSALASSKVATRSERVIGPVTVIDQNQQAGPCRSRSRGRQRLDYVAGVFAKNAHVAGLLASPSTRDSISGDPLTMVEGGWRATRLARNQRLGFAFYRRACRRCSEPLFRCPCRARVSGRQARMAMTCPIRWRGQSWGGTLDRNLCVRGDNQHGHAVELAACRARRSSARCIWS
jgi:hypothetical protein